MPRAFLIKKNDKSRKARHSATGKNNNNNSSTCNNNSKSKSKSNNSNSSSSNILGSNNGSGTVNINPCEDRQGLATVASDGQSQCLSVTRCSPSSLSSAASVSDAPASRQTSSSINNNKAVCRPASHAQPERACRSPCPDCPTNKYDVTRTDTVPATPAYHDTTPNNDGRVIPYSVETQSVTPVSLENDSYSDAELPVAEADRITDSEPELSLISPVHGSGYVPSPDAAVIPVGSQRGYHPCSRSGVSLDRSLSPVEGDSLSTVGSSFHERPRQLVPSPAEELPRASARDQRAVFGVPSPNPEQDFLEEAAVLLPASLRHDHLDEPMSYLAKCEEYLQRADDRTQTTAQTKKEEKEEIKHKYNPYPYMRETTHHYVNKEIDHQHVDGPPSKRSKLEDPGFWQNNFPNLQNSLYSSYQALHQAAFNASPPPELFDRIKLPLHLPPNAFQAPYNIMSQTPTPQLPAGHLTPISPSNGQTTPAGLPYFPNRGIFPPTPNDVTAHKPRFDIPLRRLSWSPPQENVEFPRTEDRQKGVQEKRKEKSETAQRYHCEHCGKSYSTFSGLSKHKQFHCSSQVKKEFCCKYCEKTYTSLGALKMHIRTHTLPCKCQICGKAFSRPWLLQGHVRTHTGEKPFQCPHCGRSFADRSNLRAHLQTHTDVKKYNCKTCTKTFSRMSLLLKHEDGGCPGLMA